MPPMPMLPSANRACVQVVASGIGANTSWWMARPPRRRVISTAAADTSTPSDVTPRSASAAVNLPGPHPTSTVGPRQRSSSASSTDRSAWVEAAPPSHRPTASGERDPSAVEIQHGCPVEMCR